ncbi:hypothetical protein TNCV_2941631 [Trichonephila clavipes]|nr:hypothetical protein TNCV_2941631 [Trichonephila clavipes]
MRKRSTDEQEHFAMVPSFKKRIACAKLKAVGIQASRKKQWDGQHRVLFQIHCSQRENLVYFELGMP